MASYASGSDNSRSDAFSHSDSDGNISATASKESWSGSSSGSSLGPFKFQPSASNCTESSSSAEEDDPKQAFRLVLVRERN